MKIDKLDQRLILELQEDGRSAYLELAKVLNVAEGTVRNRFKKLVDKAVIKVTAIPDLDKLGYSFMGIVGMQVRLSDLRAVAEQLCRQPNVCYLVNVTGRYDFLAIVLAKSSKEFAYFMENVVSGIPNIIRTETFVALNIYKGRENWLDTTQIINNLNIPTAENPDIPPETTK